MAPRDRGFTLVDLMVALVLFEVGMLGLLSTTATATRMITRGRRAAQAATFATQRLERLRVTACASRTAGSEVRPTIGAPLDSLTWRFVDAGNLHWRIVLRTSSLTDRGAWRIDSLETEISCLP
jgi:type II secretory pathway pseudopilin PulG